MDRNEWVYEVAEVTSLTERQAEALYRRNAGETRQRVADALDCSTSNVDTLERTARQKIINANNLVSFASAIGVVPDGTTTPIGTCAECDEPTATLKPDPNDDRDLQDQRMLCPDCAD